MAQQGAPFPILVKQGGRLVAGGSAGPVSPENYVEKVNFRRLDDAEIRREGTVLFRPNTGVPQGDQAVLPDEGDIVGIWEAVRPNGDRSAVALTSTNVYRFDYATAVWEQVGGPFQACNEWQVESLDGYLIFNNQIDLPFTFRVEEDAVVPIYEMRDIGIARVGTMCVYNGFLMVADITEIQEAELADWMSGGVFNTSSTQTKSSSFGPLPDDDEVLFEVTTGTDVISVEPLPPSGVSEGWFIVIQKVDSGSGSVSIPGVSVTLDEEGESAIIYFNGTGYEVVENESTAYGVVPDEITNRIRYKIAWSDFGQPRAWAPVISGTIEAADKDIVVLEYPVPFAFPVGAKLAVAGAGPNGGVLGGQVGIEDGVVVTAVDGAELTLGTEADASLDYPLTVTVQRFADVSTFVGSSSIQDDSSAVILLKPLKRTLAVYRETGVWSGRYTAQVATPFVFTPEWPSKNMPTLPRAVADLNGDAHVYPSNKRFYIYDGAGEPRIFGPLDDARSLFFAGLTANNRHLAWATNNPITKEIWFFCPNGVLALDYVTPGGTCSWIDESYTAAGYIRRPGSDEFWFALARPSDEETDPQLVQYAALETDDEGASALTYLRLGEPTVPRIKFGITSGGDDKNEKDILGYAPMLGTESEDFELQVLLSGGDAIARPMELVHTITLDTPATLPETDPYFRNIYFQDEIRVIDEADINVVIVGRNFRFNRVKSFGTTQKSHAA